MGKESLLVIKNKSEVLFLQLDDILYIQADGNYCNINLADGGVINTLTYQRAEIARMMEEQLPNLCKQFVMLGRSYMVNTGYVLRIQPSKQLLTFCVNRFGTTKKVSIKATAKALNELAEKIGITPANLSVLKTGKAKAIKVNTIVKMCEILDCQPGDLFEYVREDR